MVKRLINLGTKKDAERKQEVYLISVVQRNLKYKTILSSLKEGISIPDIASFFANNGWIDVNERTFTQALYAFRKAHPNLIADFDSENLDTHIDPNQPEADELSQIEQLIRLQKSRLAISFKVEKTVGMLFGATAKEIETTGKLVELKAKLRGKLSDSGKAPSEAHAADVGEDIARMRREQASLDRMHQLTKQLVTEDK